MLSFSSLPSISINSILYFSYLGLGLNEGRKRILEHGSNHSTIIKSKCINPLVNTKWTYGGLEYTIQGNLSECRNNVKQTTLT